MRQTTSLLAALLVATVTAQLHPDVLNSGPDNAVSMAASTAVPMDSTQVSMTQAPSDVTTGAFVTSDAPADVTTMMAETTTTAKPNYYPTVDEIIAAFKAISHSEYFKSLAYDDQILVLELISGGEVGKIEEVMDNIGYQRLFTFIYKIPLKYFDNLMQFILAGLEREQNLNSS